jgi:lipoate-protein ligase A
MPSEIWRILDLSYPSASQNLALEEALVQGRLSGDFTPTIRVWVNPAAAVIGRFQDVKSEVDVEFCRQKGIQIVRRFTGGGAVYHDEGNLNFTMVAPKPERMGLLELHKTNSSIVKECLKRLGLKSEFTPPNSIEVSGRKISGAAAGFHRNLSLWHWSILVSTDLAVLRLVLSPSRRYFKTTRVRSRWRPVTTLEAALGRHMPLNEVKACLLRSFEKLNDANAEPLPLSDAEEKRMHDLFTSKYSSYEWNYLGT